MKPKEKLWCPSEGQGMMALTPQADTGESFIGVGLCQKLKHIL